MKLSARTISSLKEPGSYVDSDCPGLMLLVKRSGRKSWVLRTVIHGKRSDIGLGSSELVGLADARNEARRLRAIARSGGDPLAERRKATITFEQAALRVFDQLRPTWKNKKHEETWLATVMKYAVPVFGSRPIESLGAADVLRVLSPIWVEKHETAKRLKQRIGAIFDWAKSSGYYPMENPVNGIVRALPRVKVEERHHASLSWQEVPEFYADLCDGESMSALALRFIILTAARSDEVRSAQWTEIDLDKRLWVIPGSRMKGGKEHRVPLEAEALKILNNVQGADEIYVFPSPQQASNGLGKPMSDMVFKSLMKRMKRDGFTTHGFRTSFRVWASESAHANSDVAEACLAHARGNAVQQAYDRSDLLERRRTLMGEWGLYVSGDPET